jgi:glycosyltransferase involved in cell wall biosynthesis
LLALPTPKKGITIKIAHLIDSGGMYGAEAVVINLMDVQRTMGHESLLISLGEIGNGPKEIERETADRGIQCIPLRLSKGFMPKECMQIMNTALEVGAEVIHSHGYKGDILLSLLPRRLRKLPVVSTLHGLTAKRVFTRVWFYRALDALVIRNLEGVVAVSSTSAHHPILRLCGIRPTVINNGIPRLNFRKTNYPAGFQDVLERCTNKIRMLSVGRLSEEKGHGVLIRAVKELISRSLDVGLVIIGEGSERDRLRKLAKKLDVQEHVFLVGYLPEAYLLIPHFDVFVLSSYTEGFPITLLEAMQANTPIVATEVGDVPCILDGGCNGYLVAPGDSEALATAVERLTENRQEAASKAKRAREKALNQYGIERMGTLYIEQYEQAILRYKRGK